MRAIDLAKMLDEEIIGETKNQKQEWQREAPSSAWVRAGQALGQTFGVPNGANRLGVGPKSNTLGTGAGNSGLGRTQTHQNHHNPKFT